MHITGADLTVFYYLQKYRFLTIEQCRRLIGDSRGYQSTARRLRTLESWGLLSSYGGHREGYINTFKIFYLTRKGFNLLIEETGLELGSFKQTSRPGWTAKTKHRTKLIDFFVSLEVAASSLDFISLDSVYLEYQRVKEAGRAVARTTDIFNGQKIVPDGAFILRSDRTNAKSLFLVEADLATEQISSQIPIGKQAGLVDKFRAYENYLASGAYSRKYQNGQSPFDYFVMLFVTTSQKRVENTRNAAYELNRDLDEYFYLNTFENLERGFFKASWLSRNPNDNGKYNLLG